MEVIISRIAQREIDGYKRALVSSYTSYERAIEKCKGLWGFLNSLGEFPQSHPVCRYKNLGQKFKNGKPVYLNLRRANWKDESKTQFAISYFFYEDNVIVTHFMLASHVYEDKEYGRLKSIIREEINKAFKTMTL